MIRPPRPLMVNGVDFSSLMTTVEVAAVFRVHSKTVTRWAKAGRLASIRTLGGHRRYSRAQVEAMTRRGAR